MPFLSNDKRDPINAKQNCCEEPRTKSEPFYIPSYCKKAKEKGISEMEFTKILTLVQEGERSKLGQEFHDSIGPMLSLAKLYLEMLPATTTKEKFTKEQVFSCIQTAIDQVRSISADLVISESPDKSIIQLIEQLSNKVNGTDRLKIFFRHCCESNFMNLCPGSKLVLYRIVQEQINNVIKHSKAMHVQISLFIRKNVLQLTIQDDGVGFDQDQKASGIGFANMQARIKQLQGRIKIKSNPGSGCLVDILVPLSNPQ